MPTVKVSKSRGQRLLRLSDDELKKYLSPYTGELVVAPLDSLVMDILRDLSIIRRALGIPQIDLSAEGGRVVKLSNAVMDGTLVQLAAAKKIRESALVLELARLLSRVNAEDYQILQRHWGLACTPGQLAQALHARSQALRIPGSLDLVLAITSLQWIQDSPGFESPVAV